MTRLGSTFVSEDTDARGQVGPAGNDSTVPGPAGEDSTVPGPAGDDGIVASVVAGTNITVDNTDPANPIVASTASSSPTTTQGDVIQRGASADERLAIGTASQVLAVNAGATALEYVTPSAGGGSGSNILFDVTLGSASQTIGVATLGNVSEFDFELYVPDVATAVVISAFINGDSTAGNYRSQEFQSIDSLEVSTETNGATIGVLGIGGPSLFEGKARLVDGHYTMLCQGLRHKNTLSDSLTHAGVYRELTDTDLDEISFDTNSGSLLFPAGSRLVIRDPSAAGIAGPSGDITVVSGRFAPPKASDFPTVINAQSLVVTDDPFEGLLLYDDSTDTNSDQFIMRVKPLPSGNFVATMKLKLNAVTNTFNGAGMVIRDSATSKNLILRVFTQGDYLSVNMANYNDNTFAANIGITKETILSELWLRIEDDGTNFLFSYGLDGVNFHQIASQGRTAFAAAPNQIGMFINPEADAPVGLSCPYWDDKDTPAVLTSPTTPNAFSGALVKSVANQSLTTSTDTILIFGGETYDTDDYHDNSTNNSRLTVPSGVSRVRLTAAFRDTTSVTGQFIIRILKNGGSFPGQPIQESDTAGGDAASIASPVVSVVAGDYFEVQVFVVGTRTIEPDDAVYFSIEKVS